MRFGLGVLPGGRTRVIGAFTLVGLLAITALAYAYVRHLLRPLDDIREGRAAGSGASSAPSACATTTSWATWRARSTPWRADLHRMLDGKRALLLAISHELRSPLTARA